MKTVTDNQMWGELGEQVVKTHVLGLGHVFEGKSRLETGIDGTIEFRDPATGRMTGKLVAVQVKTREKGTYTAETDAGFEYLLKAADIEYWRQSSLPVVIVLYRKSDGTLFWKDVSTVTGSEERRLVFDKSADVLDAAAMDRLERAPGSVSDDARMAKIRESLGVVADERGDRAEQVQMIFSRSYDKAWQATMKLAPH